MVEVLKVEGASEGLLQVLEGTQQVPVMLLMS